MVTMLSSLVRSLVQRDKGDYMKLEELKKIATDPELSPAPWRGETQKNWGGGIFDADDMQVAYGDLDFEFSEDTADRRLCIAARECMPDFVKLLEILVKWRDVNTSEVGKMKCMMQLRMILDEYAPDYNYPSPE